MTKIKKIINCEVIEIKTDYILIKHWDKTFVCHKSQVSDYPVDLNEYFLVGRWYKFCLINEKYISYKAIRPKLIKNKKVPMPTISGVRNLDFFLNTLIEKNKGKKITPKIDVKDLEIIKYVESHDIDLSEFDENEFSDEV